MTGIPTTIALPPARWAGPVAVALGLLWLAAGVGMWWFLAGYQASAGADKASNLGKFAVMAMVLLFVVGLQLVRALSDARITWTDEDLRLHAGDKKDPIRLARIADIEAGSPGRPVVLVLHGATRGVPVPSSSLLTRAEREELVDEIRHRRTRAHRLAKQRRAQEDAAARSRRLVRKDTPTPREARPGSQPPSGSVPDTWPTRDDAARSATFRS